MFYSFILISFLSDFLLDNFCWPSFMFIGSFLCHLPFHYWNFLFWILYYSVLKFPFKKINLCFSAENVPSVHFKYVYLYLMEHNCKSCFRILIWYSQHLNSFKVGICKLTFPLRTALIFWFLICWIILYYILDISCLNITWGPLENVEFCISRQSTQLELPHKFCLALCGLWF